MRVVIAEDATILRDGLVRLLGDRGHEVVAAVADADALCHAVAEHHPDVAVVDIRMPPTHTDEGLRAAIALREADPGLGVLVFSRYIETRYAARLLAGSAAGGGVAAEGPGGRGERLRRRADPGRPGRHRAGSGGGQPADERQASRAAGRAECPGTGGPGADGGGPVQRGIARALFITEGSVEKHVTNIFTKLGLPASDDDHRRVLAVPRYLQA